MLIESHGYIWTLLLCPPSNSLYAEPRVIKKVEFVVLSLGRSYESDTDKGGKKLDKHIKCDKEMPRQHVGYANCQLTFIDLKL